MGGVRSGITVLKDLCRLGLGFAPRVERKPGQEGMSYLNVRGFVCRGEWRCEDQATSVMAVLGCIFSQAMLSYMEVFMVYRCGKNTKQIYFHFFRFEV